jgi:hypothetical protein
LSFDLSDLLISDSSRLRQAGFGSLPQRWHETPPSIKQRGVVEYLTQSGSLATASSLTVDCFDFTSGNSFADHVSISFS